MGQSQLPRRGDAVSRARAPSSRPCGRVAARTRCHAIQTQTAWPVDMDGAGTRSGWFARPKARLNGVGPRPQAPLNNGSGQPQVCGRCIYCERPVNIDTG